MRKRSGNTFERTLAFSVYEILLHHAAKGSLPLGKAADEIAEMVIQKIKNRITDGN